MHRQGDHDAQSLRADRHLLGDTVFRSNGRVDRAVDAGQRDIPQRVSSYRLRLHFLRLNHLAYRNNIQLFINRQSKGIRFQFDHCHILHSDVFGDQIVFERRHRVGLEQHVLHVRRPQFRRTFVPLEIYAGDRE